jgi:hypothetical protein
MRLLNLAGVALLMAAGLSLGKGGYPPVIEGARVETYKKAGTP